MRKLALFAAVAGFGLVSASPPESEGGAPQARGGYPPCSARVTDECIQLYERGVRARENLGENRGLERHRHGHGRGFRHEETALAREDKPAAVASRYPPCSAAVKDECRQHRLLARRIRIAGERG